ncbi:hypothetical protein J4573_00700 [Actinomadura barringtoniae]|uniref:Uncharacterized protein n=2 Tax=Actinomadura barringtoniae TaxID=1427535 RepID=A0A939T2Q7_9ACTN|nr:hypothetical protein [Actinomadura barringtoniae]
MTPRQLHHYLTSEDEDEEECPGEALATPALPPAAHPERLVPDEPLSEEASRLWAELNMGGWPTV